MVDEETPRGWKFKIISNEKAVTRISYLSPRGERIQGRRSLFKHLMKSKDMEAAEKVKKLLIKYDDWQESEYLPSGWLYKDVARLEGGRLQHNYSFLTREGCHYESARPVPEHIKCFPGYNSLDLDNFNKLLPKVHLKRRKEMQKWSHDDSVPDAWMTRVVGEHKGKFFLSPSGEQFQTRRTALVHMLSNNFNYSKEDVDRMRQGFASEGWLMDVNLPKDWWYRVNLTCKEKVSIVTANGNQLRNMKSAEEYIRVNESEALQNFDLFKQGMNILLNSQHLIKSEPL